MVTSSSNAGVWLYLCSFLLHFVAITNAGESFPANKESAMDALNPRQQQVLQLAREHGYVTVEDLADRLAVTHQTIRRDINFLCDQGILARFHGGAAWRSSVANVPYEARRDSLTQEKQAIARAVAAEIPDNSSVFIDIGTTAEAVAVHLASSKGLRVVTNNINVVNLLAKNETVEMVICGGVVRSRDLAIWGPTATEFITRFQFDYAILGVVGISQDGSILDFSVDEEPLTQAIIKSGRHVYVVADHTKFGRHAMVKVAHLSQISAVFTDAAPSPQWLELMENLGVRTVVSG